MKCLLLLFSCQALSNSLPPHGLQLASPLSMGLPRQEHWSGLPFSSPEDLPDLGTKPMPSTSVGGFFKTEPPGKPINCLERHWGKKNYGKMGMAILVEKAQFSSVTQSCPNLCNPMDCSSPGFPVHHQLPEIAQTHVHRVSDIIQPSHPLWPPSPPAFSLPQHQGLFQ